MEILLYSINIIGCIIYFLFSIKSNYIRKHEIPDYDNDLPSNNLNNLNYRVTKLEDQIVINKFRNPDL